MVRSITLHTLARATLLLAITSLLAALIWLVTNRPQALPAARVYPLGTLWTQMQRDPARWIGRTVRVRALAVQCTATLSGPGSPCLDQRPALLEPAPSSSSALLPLAPAPEPGSPTWLRGLPVLGLLLSGPPKPAWGVPATYTIRVQRIPCANGSSCLVAALL